MKGFSFSSLRARLVLLVLFAVIPALGLILYTAAEQRRWAAVEAQQNLLRLAQSVSDSQNDLIEGARQLLTAAAQIPMLRDSDPAECNSFFSMLVKKYPNYTNLGVVTPAGDIFCSGLPLSGPVNVADRAWFRRAVENRDFAIGDYIVGRVTGKATLGLSYPVLDEAGDVQAVFYAGLDLGWLNTVVAKTQLPPGATLTVIDRNGTILVRFPHPEKWVGKSMPETPLVQTILRQGSFTEGTAEARGVDGLPRLYGFSSLGRTRDAYVSVGIPKDVAFATANRILLRNLVALGLVAVLALLAAWFGAGLFVVRRVNDLVSATKRLSEGDLGARTELPNGKGELSELARAFDQMAGSMERLVTERKHGEEEVQRHLQRVTILREINVAITSTLDLHSVLKVLMEKIDLLLPYTAVLVWLWDRKTGLIERAACWNLDEEEWKGRKLRSTPALVLQAIDTKKPAVVRDVRTDPRTLDPDFYRRQGLVSYLGVPLIVKDEVLGVLVFLTREEHEFSEEEIEFLSMVTGQAAVAIYNSQLYEQMTQRTQALSALYTVTATASQTLSLDTVLQTMAKQIGDVFRFDTTRVFLLDSEMNELHLKASFDAGPGGYNIRPVVQLGVGISGRVAKSGQPMIFENVNEDPQYQELSETKATQKAAFSFFAVFPIKTKLRTVGTLVCIGRTPRHLKTDEIQLIVSMTEQAGVAIENASLFERTKAQAVELEKANKDLERRGEVQKLLKELSQDITSMEIESLVKKLTEKVREFFKVDVCDVRLVEKGRLISLGVSGIEPDRLRSHGTGTPRGQSKWIIENRRPLLVPDATDRSKHLSHLGFRSYLGIPLFARSGEVIAILRALSYDPREFTQEEMDLFQLMANGFGVALESARLVEQIKNQAVELEKANKVKGEFLGFVSHELKTPVGAVMGYTEMLEDGVFGEISPKQRKTLEKVTTYCRDLVSMIDGLLEATRIEAGAIKLEREEVAVIDFLDELKLVYSVPLNKELVLIWNYPSELPAIKTDREKLKHILQNLISNAIKYTDKGNVTISVRVKGGRSVEFTVEDTGIGIPEELLPVIFEMFRQAERSKNGLRGGVGLGLHIVKKFTELLGGTVEVESEVGKGSTFTVTVPWDQ